MRAAASGDSEAAADPAWRLANCGSDLRASRGDSFGGGPFELPLVSMGSKASRVGIVTSSPEALGDLGSFWLPRSPPFSEPESSPKLSSASAEGSVVVAAAPDSGAPVIIRKLN